MDEQSQHLVFIKVNQLYNEIDDSLDLVSYLTLLSRAIRQAQKNGWERKCVTSFPCRNFIRTSLYSGRVQNWRLRFQIAPNFKRDILNQNQQHPTTIAIVRHSFSSDIISTTENTLIALAVNSLNPTIMAKYDVHVGEVENLTKTELINFMECGELLYVIRFKEVTCRYSGSLKSFYLMGERTDSGFLQKKI